MNATRNKTSGRDADTIPQSPQTTPSGIGTGLPGHDFTLQAVMEMQKTLGKMEHAVENLASDMKDIKAKTSRMEKILYAAGVVIAIGIFVGGWMINTGKEFAILAYKESLDQAKSNPKPSLMVTPQEQPIQPIKKP